MEREINQKASDQELIEKYKELGSVWKVADCFKMCGQSVHERLVKLEVINHLNILTENEKQKIKELYEAGFVRGDGRLEALCLEIGRTKPFVCRYAKEIGLTSFNRKVGKSLCKKMSKRSKKWHEENDHPRGMLGKHQTEKTKLAVSQAHLGVKIPSKTVMKMLKTKHDKGNLYNKKNRGSWRGQWLEIGGNKIFFRSRWEINYAIYLEFLKNKSFIKEWKHEPKTFWFEKIRRGTRSYLPDFLVVQNDLSEEYHEVKGWHDKKSLTKLKRMKIYYPEIKLILINCNDLLEIEKNNDLPGWTKIKKESSYKKWKR